MASTPARPVPVDAPTALLLRAIERAEAGARAEAKELAAKAQASAPGSALVHVAAAQIRFASGDREGAFAALDRARAADAAKGGVALSWKALLLRRQGRLAAALAVLDELGAIEGHAASARAFAAEIRAAARDDEGALREIEAAIAAGAEGAKTFVEKAEILARLGRVAEAQRALAAAVAAQPGSARLALDAGVRWMDLGAFDEAEAAFTAAAADADTRPPARAHLARLRLWWGDLDGAAALAGEALVADPELALGLSVRGAIHVLRGEHAAAIAILDRAIAIDEALSEAFVWRAEAASRLGDRERALADLERATWTWGDYFAAHLLRLLLAARTAAKGTRVSLYAYESVLAGVSGLLPDGAAGLATEDPAVIGPLLERALAALGGNRSPTITTVREDAGARRLARVAAPATARFAAKWTQERIQVAPLPEVLDRFEAVLREHASSSKPYCYRGELRLWVGDLAGAREDFERALATEPTTKWAYIGLCATEMLEGHLDAALATCARGVALTGEGPSLFVYRGEAHRRRGDLDAAAADLEIACRMNPSRVAAWVNLALVQGARGEVSARDATLDRLRWQAPSLLDDAARPGGDVEGLLARCLAMMRGNRSSTCVTYFVGDELRVVPFAARGGEDGSRRMLAALRDALLRGRRR